MPPEGPALTTQLDLAFQARDEALDRVEGNADAEWFDRALEAVRRVCQQRTEWIVDDVWAELGWHDKPREARAMGAVIRAGVRLGWCRGTREYRPSAQSQCHGNPRKVWRSR